MIYKQPTYDPNQSQELTGQQTAGAITSGVGSVGNVVGSILSMAGLPAGGIVSGISTGVGGVGSLLTATGADKGAVGNMGGVVRGAQGLGQGAMDVHKAASSPTPPTPFGYGTESYYSPQAPAPSPSNAPISTPGLPSTGAST